MSAKKASAIFTILVLAIFVANLAYSQDDESTRNILKNGLLGAGTGAIAAGTSGGNAGQGALIGAGTNVIGGALLDMLTTPSAPARSAPPPQQYNNQGYSNQGYYDDQQQEEYYEPPPQQSGTQKILKNGLLGAGTGAIAAGASGGNAGKGALIGAGTNVIGGAILDMLTQPSPQPRRAYRRQAPPPPQQQQGYTTQQQGYTTQTSASDEDTSGAPGTRKKIVRKYDDSGKVVSEEEIYY